METMKMRNSLNERSGTKIATIPAAYATAFNTFRNVRFSAPNLHRHGSLPASRVPSKLSRFLRLQILALFKAGFRKPMEWV